MRATSVALQPQSERAIGAALEALRADDGGPTRAVARRRSVVLLGGYLVVSLWLWRSLVPHLATHSLGGGLLDPGLFTWWLRWTPFALTHGMNPFHSRYLDAPGGVNAMWNTSVPALGVIFAPVTLLFSAVVSFNLACILGPPLSAWTASIWLRRHVGEASAALGGLLFGFSPFVMAHSRGGHLSFTWLLLLPIIMMLVEDLLWRAPRPLWPQAPLLGVVVALQLLISSEALLILSFGCVGMVLVLAVSNPRATRQRLRVLIPAGAVALGVASLLSALPLVEQFTGPGVVRRPVGLGARGGTPAMLVSAPSTLLFHTGNGPTGHLGPVENGLYIGWPLLIAIAAAAVLLVRRPGVVAAALAVLVSAALQMRVSNWHVGGRSVPAPFRLLRAAVAVTRNIEPSRFATVMWLAIAWLFAVAVDAAVTKVRATNQHPRWALLPFVAAALVLLPLVPGRVTPVPRVVRTPSLFTTSLRAIIPKGSTVMIAPMATVGDNAAQFWQVKAGMRFRQIGGYMLHGVGPSGAPSYYPSAQMLTTLFRISEERPYAGKVTGAMLDGARSELRAAHASLFIVGPVLHTGESRLLAIAEMLLQRPPDRRVGGVSIWALH